MSIHDWKMAKECSLYEERSAAKFASIVGWCGVNGEGRCVQCGVYRPPGKPVSQGCEKLLPGRWGCDDRTKELEL